LEQEFYDFPYYWEESSQLTNSYFSEGWLNHQPGFDEAGGFKERFKDV
jgi:hypothetical protein